MGDEAFCCIWIYWSVKAYQGRSPMAAAPLIQIIQGLWLEHSIEIWDSRSATLPLSWKSIMTLQMWGLGEAISHDWNSSLKPQLKQWHVSSQGLSTFHGSTRTNLRTTHPSLKVHLVPIFLILLKAKQDSHSRFALCKVQKWSALL